MRVIIFTGTLLSFLLASAPGTAARPTTATRPPARQRHPLAAVAPAALMISLNCASSLMGRRSGPIPCVAKHTRRSPLSTTNTPTVQIDAPRPSEDPRRGRRRRQRRVSFRREAHVPRGGPDGGDGGRGGDVVLVCDASRRDLATLRFSPHQRAGRGGHGEGSQRHGARGDDASSRFPPGPRSMGSRAAPTTWSAGSARDHRRGRPAVTATSASRPRRARRRGLPSAASRARRAGSSCG